MNAGGRPGPRNSGQRPMSGEGNSRPRNPENLRSPQRRGSARDRSGGGDSERMGKGLYIDARDGRRYRKNKGRSGGRGHRSRMPVLLAGLAVVIALLAGGYFYVDSLAYHVIRLQAGAAVEPSDFIKKPDAEAVFVAGGDSFDVTVPGEYQVKVKSGFFTHKCKLIVEDTLAPTGQAVQVRLPIGNTCGPESFVTDIEDATKVTVSYVTEPDFARKGSQPVQIALTDLGNNRTVLDTELYLSIVAEHVTMEAGEGAPGLDKFVAAGETGQFVTDMTGLDYARVGDYEIALTVNGESYTSILHVRDTVPPVVEVKDLEDFAFVPKDAIDFAVRVEDVTEVTAAFKKDPDLSQLGTQEVALIFTDQGGNQVEKTAKLTLKKDDEPPVIHGALDMTIYAGDTVSYRKDVTVTDNSSDGITLDVDTSKVNTRAEGVYPVTYTASDASGNKAQLTVNLTVLARKYDIEEVNALGDSVLARILKPEMSEMDKLQAIYSYIMGHISYINDSDKGDWVQAAYEGLMNRKGDCYVYASTAKLLLTRAGIKNMDIEKIPSDTLHYWNLVDIGDGWYHFDTTPRKDHPTIFMWDDKQMMDYSNSHDKSHNYDRALYPEINGAETGQTSEGA